MTTLFWLLHSFIGSVLAGSAIIAVLVLGYDSLVPIVIAAVSGFVLSFPVSWVIARKLSAR